jgi:hypothetical protein
MMRYDRYTQNMKLLSSICYPNYDQGKLIVIKLEGAINVKDHRKHPILYLT